MMEFNKEYEQLKILSNELDDENITLDDAIAKYEEACKIIEKCTDELVKAKGKITVLRDSIEKKIEENLE